MATTKYYNFPLPSEDDCFDINSINQMSSLVDTTLKAIADINNATAINEPLRVLAEASRVLSFNGMQHSDPILELSTARNGEIDLNTRLNKDNTTNSIAIGLKADKTTTDNIQTSIGILPNLTTTSKISLVNAINEVNDKTSNGSIVNKTGLLSGLHSYDLQKTGFGYLATDTGNLYVKNSDTSGDWSPPIPFKGDKGDKGDTGLTGATGIQGLTGDTGATTYTWIKYGTDSAGTGLTDSPNGMTYIGIAVNKLTLTKSTNATDYTWSLIQGATGNTGEKGDIGLTGASATSYWLSLSSPVIQKSIVNVYTPLDVSLTAKCQIGNSTPIAYTGRFIIEESIDGITYTTKYTSVSDESAKNNYVPSVGIKTLRMSLYLLGGTTTLLDQQIIPIVSDGKTGDKGDTGATGSKGDAGTNFTVDQTGLLANLNTYGAQLDGFSYLATDTGNLYIKMSNTLNDWSNPMPFKGDKGDKGDIGLTGLTGVAGTNAITGLLTNYSVTIATDVSGNNGIYTNATTTMKIYNGIIDDTANWIFVANPLIGVTGSLTTNVYTVTGMTVDNGYVDITASRTSYASITQRFSLSKSKQGAVGATGATGNTGATGATYDDTEIRSELATNTTNIGNKVDKSIFTTTGDIIYANGANTPVRLAKGTDGQGLILSGGLPTWGNVQAPIADNSITDAQLISTGIKATVTNLSDTKTSVRFSTFTSTVINTTNVVHGFTGYNPVTDKLVVLGGVYNSQLIKDVNYTENADNLSIDLNGWSLAINDVINFELYKNSLLNIQNDVSNAVIIKTNLDASVLNANTTKTNLENVISNADLTTYASKGSVDTVISDLASNSSSINDFVTKFGNSKTIDLFMCMGQSNMSGLGVASQAPIVPHGQGYEFRAITDATKLYDIIEPFGLNESKSGGINDTIGLKTGSMISAFAIAYYNSTKIQGVFVSASEGGTSIDDWIIGGARSLDAIARYNTTKTWLQANGYTVRHSFMLWMQGESDGDTSMDKYAYTSKLDTMITGLCNIGIEKCFMIRIGNQSSEPALYDEIISAETEFCKTRTNTVLISTKAVEFADRGLMKDLYHYTQPAYNELGTDAGQNCALYVKNNIPPILSDYENNNLYYPYKVTGDNKIIFTFDIDHENGIFDVVPCGTVASGYIDTNTIRGYKKIPNSIILTCLKEWSVEFTILPSQVINGDKESGILLINYDTPDKNYIFVNNNANLIKLEDNSSNIFIFTVPKATLDVKHNYCITYNGKDSMILYIDAVSFQTLNITAIADIILKNMFGGYVTAPSSYLSDYNYKGICYYLGYTNKVLQTRDMHIE